MTTTANSATYPIGGDLPVRRLGYGTMQLTGPGHWGLPADVDNAIRILRHAVDLGVNHLDTADAYGPHTVEELIRRALHPYPDGLVIATKGGLTRHGPHRWAPCGRPEYLRQCAEMSLRRLRLDRIDLYYLHRIDQKVPLADQVGTLNDLRCEGKIRHAGLSKVSHGQLVAAATHTTIAAVQNHYSPTTQDPILRHAERHDIAYVAYAPFHRGDLITGPSTHPPTTVLNDLLARSPAMLTIPGTAHLGHLIENIGGVPAAPSS
ncbi:aldo/keto reductase [Actinoplanes sp. NPDC051346]|uniref:aldo/keto reductase n=1 Tax=Actinoplanes sp. NPDC051346 TaxID=3155048 RepID=UPI00341241EF